MLVLKGHVNPKIQVYPVLRKKVFLKTILQLFFAIRCSLGENTTFSMAD